VKAFLIGTALLALSSSACLAGEQTVTLAVEKMNCVLCPITVRKAIESVEGVIKVAVEYDTKRAMVRYDDGTTTWEIIAEASTNAGYPASKVE